VRNDRIISNNLKDTIIRNNEKGTCMLMGFEIPGDRNVIKTEYEKILKYKDVIEFSVCGMRSKRDTGSGLEQCRIHPDNT
jgi:hypothetical protein